MAELPKLYIDNPGGDWLQRKLETAQEYYRTAPLGSSRRNIGASDITGYFKTALDLSPDLLKDLPGALGEEAWREDSVKLENLEKRIREQGYEPSPILINVREDGTPFIVEGNHRVAEALKSGRTSIPVELRYLRGAEDAEGPLSLTRLQRYYESRPKDKSKLPAVIDAVSAASQLARTQADEPRPKGKGEVFRGIGSLMRRRMFPLIQAAQSGYNLLSEEQKKEVEEFLARPAHELVGMDKPGIDYFRDLIGTGSEDAQSPARLEDFFENMGEDGVGEEFPEIFQSIERYVYDVDASGINDALKSADYPMYRKVLEANLNRSFPGDTIPVQRTENYLMQQDPETGGVTQGPRDKRVFEVAKEDVLLAGNEGELELIIDGAKYGYDGTVSVRALESFEAKKMTHGGMVDKPLYDSTRLV